jgi:hypothetical protein
MGVYICQLLTFFLGYYDIDIKFFHTHEPEIEPLTTCLRGQSPLPLGPTLAKTGYNYFIGKNNKMLYVV